MVKKAGIIQARYGSTRFPHKVLERVDGKPLLQLQWERLQRAKTLDTIILATTGSPIDDPIFEIAEKLKMPVFRGSERDVLDRYYRAAKHFGIDVVARITSDCPLLDPAVVDQVMDVYLRDPSRFDFVANNTPPSATFPDGMDVEVFSMSLLERAWREAVKPSEREHVTFFFWKQPERFKLHRVDAPEDWSHYRLTVDYPEDLEVIRRLVDHFHTTNKFGSLPEIIAYLRDPAARLPKSTHVFGEGWQPSLQQDALADTVQTVKAPALKLQKTEAAWKRALTLIPTGAQTFSKTPNQFVAGVAPKMVARGRGSRVWDLDGNEYLDYTLSLGPTLLGHSHPEVNRAAARCADETFNCPPLPHVLESDLAETLRRLIPSAEMVKYGKNGSDVTTAAVRVARAYTGRDHVAFCGYHGWHDWHIGATSRKKGVPEAVQRLTHRFQYNKIETLKKILSDHPGQVAAVILEPVGHTPPENQFLEKVKHLTQEHGAVLIFDEIITGFRIDLGGAQTFFGVTPDLSTFGKAMANGYPISVLCGRKDLMEQLEEVFFSFTFGGELPTIAAALKTIEILERDKVLPYIAQQGTRLRDGFNQAAKGLSIPFARCVGMDFWPEIMFDAAGGFSSLELLTLFQQEIVRRGILTRAPLFVSAAHSPCDITVTLRIFRDALAVVKLAVQNGSVKAWTEGDLIHPVIRNESSPDPAPNVIQQLHPS